MWKTREREESGLISQHVICTPHGQTCCFLGWGQLGALQCHTEHEAPFRHLGGMTNEAVSHPSLQLRGRKKARGTVGPHNSSSYVLESHC